MKSLVDFINESKIEYKEFTGKVTKLKKLKNSFVGNPAWEITMENEKGAVISGRTTPNVSLGYWLSSNKEGQTLTLSYHYTNGGKLYFDSKVDKKDVNESLDNKIVVTYKKKGSVQTSYYAKSIGDAKRFLKNNEPLEYFELQKGSSHNFSETDGLICWYGKGGYWANAASSADYKGEERKGRDLKFAEKARKYEVSSIDEI